MVCQMIFNGLIFYFLGIKFLIYLLVGIFLVLGFYFLVGYFIFEYYFFYGKQVIILYYGLFNFILFNVGYYIEYYDFLYILYNCFLEVRKIVVEYYDYLYYIFWVKVFWDFVFDSNMGLYVWGVGYRKDEIKEY